MIGNYIPVEGDCWSSLIYWGLWKSNYRCHPVSAYRGRRVSILVQMAIRHADCECKQKKSISIMNIVALITATNFAVIPEVKTL